VRAYIAEHAYGNATSADLWRAIDKAAGKPVSAVARDFTTQPGVPLISVTTTADRVTLSQSRFTTADATLPTYAWRTPVLLQPLLGGPPTERLVSRGSPQAAWGQSVVNAGGTGYYRVSYDAPAFSALADRFGRLPAADQFGLLKDTLALGMAGGGPISAYLRLTATLPADAEPVVWREQARTLAGLDGYYAPGPKRAAYRAWASGLLRPVLARAGFDARKGEPAADALMRETLLLALGQIGDPTVSAEARRRFAGARNDLSRLAPGERRWVLVGAARSADPATFKALRSLARAARDPLERNDLYVDLAAVEDKALAAEVLKLAITDEAPSNMAPALVREVSAVHPELAWQFTLDNLPAITRSLEALGRSTFVPRVAGASNDLQAALALQKYAAKNIPADAQGEVQVAISRIRNNADIQARRLPEIDAWIAGREPTADS
jgi:aminopeptidase N